MSRKDTLLAFRITAEEKKLFQEAAKREEMPLSFWIRRTLKGFTRKRKDIVIQEISDAVQ